MGSSNSAKYTHEVSEGTPESARKYLFEVGVEYVYSEESRTPRHLIFVEFGEKENYAFEFNSVMRLHTFSNEDLKQIQKWSEVRNETNKSSCKVPRVVGTRCHLRLPFLGEVYRLGIITAARERTVCITFRNSKENTKSSIWLPLGTNLITPCTGTESCTYFDHKDPLDLPPSPDDPLKPFKRNETYKGVELGLFYISSVTWKVYSFVKFEVPKEPRSGGLEKGLAHAVRLFSKNEREVFTELELAYFTKYKEEDSQQAFVKKGDLCHVTLPYTDGDFQTKVVGRVVSLSKNSFCVRYRDDILGEEKVVAEATSLIWIPYTTNLIMGCSGVHCDDNSLDHEGLDYPLRADQAYGIPGIERKKYFTLNARGRMPKKPEQEKKKIEREEGTCAVCLDKQVGVIFVECGHGACKECCDLFVSCHMCKQPITKKVDVYL